LRRLVRCFDRWLSRRYGIFEFSQHPDCLLRLQAAVAHRSLTLPDRRVERGEPVLLLHLWNERLSALPPVDAGLSRAKTMQRMIIRSLTELACYVDQHPELAQRRALGGVTVLLGAGSHAGGVRLVERLGFSVFPYHSPLGCFGEFWENFYAWVLIWTYDPASLPYHRLLSLRRREFWISTDEFRRRYRPGQGAGAG